MDKRARSQTLAQPAMVDFSFVSNRHLIALGSVHRSLSGRRLRLIELSMLDESLARKRIAVAAVGTLLLFEVHDYKQYPRDPTSDEMARDLSANDSAHRNLFLVGADGHRLWRVGDYVHHEGFPDQIVNVWIEESDHYAYAWTFRGYKLRIDIRDGSTVVLKWSK